MTTLVAIVALAFAKPTPAAHSLRDLEFARANEDFVIRIRGTAPPAKFDSLITLLGDPCHRCRERATAELFEESRADSRWIFWGMRHRDPEVRTRATSILRRLNPCKACRGTGISTYNPDYSCYECHGTKTTWDWATGD